MNLKKDDIFPYDMEDGIVIDYIDHKFIMVLKDSTWSEFEVKGLTQKKCTISFVYERICAIFLFGIDDCIETSDASFDIHNCEYAEEILSPENECFVFEVYFIDEKNKITGLKKMTLTKEMSKVIQSNLAKQFDATYDDAGFDKALAKLQSQYEPFELEEIAKTKAIY